MMKVDAPGPVSRRLSKLVLNGVKPFAYLRDTLTAIANGHPANRIDELMPWAYVKMSS